MSQDLYLITGGAGFIGSHIAEALLERGGKVRVFDNLSSGHLENLAAFKDRVEFVKGDVRDAIALSQAMKGVRYVYHEAALVSVFDSVERPLDNNDINITGTLNVLRAAKAAGAQRLLIASSAANYGNNPALPKREDMLPEPESPYAIGKIVGEYYLRIFSSLYGLETVSLRYFNVFGPRQDPRSMYSGVISKFTDVLAKGQTPTIFGDGGQTRDFVFVKDVVQANILAMHSDKVGKGEVFNVGTGRKASLLDLLDALCDAFGVKVQPVFKEARAGDIRHSLSDITKIRTTLGYEPKYTLHQGLKELVDSVRK
jgi:nucleoside-diphosphate-sugar epimerase